MKRIKYPILFSLLISLLVMACQPNHFIKDQTYLESVNVKFSERKALVENRSDDLFSVFNRNLSLQEKEALKFLFAYMPLNDLADYSGEFFYDQMKASFKAKEEMSWGTEIPEDIFIHFVLPYRVNNENLDSFRLVYYDEIKSRVAGLSLKEAALEVNRWCHEKVSYQPADIRTSSPMNTIKSARGRCGEESTFTVAALRTVAIPARQVYTPRWAHSDDNHAWVEVWIDGSWHFLGACEPDIDLDMGWFVEPARRAMLIHTKAFGAYEGQEPLVKNTKNYGEINSLDRYAITKTVSVRVVDENSLPVEDAEVRFSLFNYAEFYPLAVLRTGKNGTASFLTGLGDLLVWVSKGEKITYGKMSVDEVDTLEVVLEEMVNLVDVELDMVPPVLREPLSVPQEGREENNIRLKEEDRVRNNYLATFMDSVKAVDLAKQVGFDPSQVLGQIRRSAGNYQAIADYLSAVPKEKKEFAIDLLMQVSEKDLRDVPAEVFLDHLNYAFDTAGDLPEENRAIFVKYVLAPRIMNELLVDYRRFLQEAFSKELSSFPVKANELIKWINDNISINDAEVYYEFPITPKGVYKLRASDRYSRKIFFIASCRSLGIPARMDRIFQVPQYNENGKWTNVFFTGDNVLPGQTAKLLLVNEENKKLPQYHIHFTLSYLQKGVYKTLELGFGSKPELFKAPLTLPVGDYLMITGNRMNNGGVLSKLSFFHLDEGEERRQEVKLRESVHQKQDYGKLDMNSELESMIGKRASLSQLTDQKNTVLVWIEPDKEPSKHVLNDIPLLKNNFDEIGSSIIFIVPESRITPSFNPATYKGLPEKVFFFVDKDDAILKSVSGEMKRETGLNLPLILIVNSEGKIWYHSEGYRIGIGEHLVKALSTEK